MSSERRLIRKVQRSGDVVAADALVRRYYDEIYRYVARQMFSKTDALDLTQEIFVSMLSSIGRYDHKKASFRTWLYRIATNKTIDLYRSRARRPEPLLALDDVNLSDSRLLAADDSGALDEHSFEARLAGGDLVAGNDLVAGSDLVEAVCEHVATLPLQVQQVFRLKFFGEHTFAQIAEILHIPEATAKTRYYRLLHELRKEFHDADV